MFLEVKRAMAGAQVELGAVYVISEEETTLGRSSSADIVLRDARVSRRHARLLLKTGGLWLENLSRHGTFVNEAPAIGRVRLQPRDWIQIGGVLFRVSEAVTQPLDGPMKILRSSLGEGEPAQTAPFEPVLRILASSLEVWFLGQPVALRPSLFRTLACLAEHAGQWIRTEHLAEAIWPDENQVNLGYVNKHVSYVRNALHPLLEGDAGRCERLRRALHDGADRFSRIGELDTLEGRGLLLELIKARKKVGFRLSLAPVEAALEPAPESP